VIYSLELLWPAALLERILIYPAQYQNFWVYRLHSFWDGKIRGIK